MNKPKIMTVGLLICLGYLLLTTLAYSDNGRVNLYSDRYGNTTGWVNGQKVYIYSDKLGNTTGRIGNSRINLYQDRLGNTTGTIKKQGGGLLQNNKRMRRLTDQY